MNNKNITLKSIYETEYTIEADYGYGDGWEEVFTETTKEEALKRLKEYRENAGQYLYRLRVRDVKINNNIKN